MKQHPPKQRDWARRTTWVAAAFGLAMATSALAEDQVSGRNADVTLVNGYADVRSEDLTVQSLAGPVSWTRSWDGFEWKFNPEWESLSYSFRNMTGSMVGDTDSGSQLDNNDNSPGASGTASGGVPEGCWVWVDEDWQPSSGTVVVNGTPYLEPMDPARAAPFNKFLSGYQSGDSGPTLTERVNVDYATLCPGGSASSIPTQFDAIRLISMLFLGNDGRYSFDNRNIIEKGDVQALPTTPVADGETPLASGQISVAPVTLQHGYRYIMREGGWTAYNPDGQAVAMADRNGNINWLQRDSDGKLLGVVDHAGHVLMSIHYEGARITRVRDYPRSGIAGDAPSRSVQYSYDQFNRMTDVTNTRGFVTHYDYDPMHRLTQITDAEGRVGKLGYKDKDRTIVSYTAADGGNTSYEFSYDDVNKQFTTKIYGPQAAGGQRVTSFLYNRVGKLLRRVVNGKTELEVRYDTATSTQIRTNARGYATRITKNEFEQITSVLLPDGRRIDLNYDPRNLTLLDATDEDGVKTHFEYDTNGNLLRETAALGLPEARVTVFTYNAVGLPETITRKGRTEANGTTTPDAVWQVLYDENGQVRQVTDPEGKVRHYVFDRRGNLLQATDPLGQSWTFTYDGAGNIFTETDPLSHTTHYAYDKVGNLITATDARGKSWQLGYDAVDRLNSLKNPYGAEFSTAYDVYGQMTNLTDPSGHSLKLDYDALQRLVKATDGRSQTYQFKYTDADGSERNLPQPRSLQFPSFTRQLRYNERDWLSLSSDQAGSAQRTENYAYDGTGRQQSLTDAHGKTSTYTYNAFGEVTQATDAMGHSVALLRDARGNVIQVTDPNGHATTFQYDRRDLLTQTTDPLNHSTAYGYDDNGRLTDLTQANGQKVHYDYDDAGRVHEYKEYDAANTLVKTTSFDYDEADNLTGWNDGTVSALRAYDDAGRLSSEMLNTGSFTLSHSYTYQANDQIGTYTGPDGVTVTYGYDALGQLQSLSIPDEGTLSVTDWQWFQPKTTLLPGGSQQRREYDGFMELTHLKTVTAGQAGVFDLQNQYGSLAELTQTTRDQTSLNYGYDDALRLTSVESNVSGREETFELDPAGNRTLHSRTGSDPWSYDDANQLTSRGPISYQYDNAGNLIQKTDSRLTEPQQTTHYRYDAFNRLIEVKDGSNHPIAAYAYDPFNRRIKKTATTNTTWYLQGEQGLLAEADQTGTIQISYGWNPEREYGTDPIYARVPGSEPNTYRYLYYQNDQLGTPQRITDKTGAIVWAADYDAFGYATIHTSASDPVTSNLRFPGQYYDQETGLYYNFNRYYDPETGRYISRDPIGFEGGVNLYAYVGGNPIGLGDPSGLLPELPGWLVDFSSGFGDTISFGLSSYIRGQWNIDGGVNKCSSAYGAGRITSDVVSLIGGGGLIGKSFIRFRGTEWSHFLPDRWIRPFTRKGRPNSAYIPWLDNAVGRAFFNSRFNGNFVTRYVHRMSDYFRQFPGMTNSDPRWSLLRRFANRIPGFIPGSALVTTPLGNAGPRCPCDGTS